MTAIITHSKVSTIPDKQDELAQGKVCPSHWNENHVLTGLTAAESAYTPSGGLVSTNVQDAIDELAGASGTLSFIFANIASSIATYYQAVSITNYTTGAVGTSSASASTTPTVIANFATNAGYPNITEINAGLLSIHYDVQKSAGSNNYYTYAELYKRSSAGTETLIATTDNSSQSAVNTVLSVTVTATISSPITLLATDRLVVKVYAVMVSSTATITCRFDDATSARVELPASSSDIASGIYDSFIASLASYKNLYTFAASHTAAKVAGTYSLSSGGQVATVSGTGSLPPQAVFYLRAADFPAIGGLATKLRVVPEIHVNDVAPSHSFTFGLHTVTTPATSGGTGLRIYTIGAAVSGSTVTYTTPAADSDTVTPSSDFAFPADGWYALAFTTDGTMAASSHVHMASTLQMRNA